MKHAMMDWYTRHNLKYNNNNAERRKSRGDVANYSDYKHDTITLLFV